jgi:protein-tyrosine phosphatase
MIIHECDICMDEVSPKLYVGAESAAEDHSLLQNHDIDTVISLTHETPATGTKTCIDIPMVDGPQNDYQAFLNAVETVIEARENEQCVLIHCAAGSSRSPAVAAAAIAVLTDATLNETFNQIIERRPTTDPHDALILHAAKVVDQNNREKDTK